MIPSAFRSLMAALALTLLLPATAPAQSTPAQDKRMDDFHAARKAGDAAGARAILDELVGQGHPRALVEQAEAHRSGDGAEKDAARALKLYEQAAKSGHAPSYAPLGVMYWNGEGTAADGEQALRWLKKGIEARQPDAMYAAAMAFEQGRPDVSKNVDQARFWFVRARFAGHEGARRRLQEAGYRAPTDVMAAFNRIVQESGGRLRVANYRDEGVDGGTFSLYRTASGGAGGNVVWMMDFGVKVSPELRTVIAARVRKSERSTEHEAQEWRRLLLRQMQLDALNPWLAVWDSDLAP